MIFDGIIILVLLSLIPWFIKIWFELRKIERDLIRKRDEERKLGNRRTWKSQEWAKMGNIWRE